MKRPGRPRSVNRTTKTIRLDNELNRLYEHKRRGMISEDINTALRFWFGSLKEHRQMRHEIARRPLAECLACKTRFKLVVAECPNCRGNKVCLVKLVSKEVEEECQSILGFALGVSSERNSEKKGAQESAGKSIGIPRKTRNRKK